MKEKFSRFAKYIVPGILLAAVIAVSVLLVVESIQSENKLRAQSEEFGQTIDRLEVGNSELEADKAKLESELSSLEAEIAKLNSQISELEAKLSDSGSSYQSELESLKSELEAKLDEIALLEADIEKFTKVYSIDIRAQAQLLDELIEFTSTKCPYVRMVDEIILDEDGNETGEVTYKWVKVADLEEEARLAAEEAEVEYIEGQQILREDVFYPSISFYYEDLATGYHFGYNEQVVYDPASVIKAPVVAAVLQQIARDEKSYLDSLDAQGKLPELIDTNGDGVADSKKIVWSNPSFELNDKVAYNKETMFKPGSGKIQDMDEGTEFSYYDFVRYALEYSDNIAYNQIKVRFGYQPFYSFAAKAGATTASRNANKMTAEDAGKLFKAIWEFAEDDEKYGGILKTSMAKANHTVIIPYGVSPSKVMHKYGWDVNAYHDAAIVQNGDKPYVLAIFSDLDNGGDEVNEFLREIVKKINQLHKNFYR